MTSARLSPKRNLQATRLSAGYLRALASAWAALVSFALLAGTDHPSIIARSSERTNLLLIDFIQHAYDMNFFVSVARNAVLVMQTLFRQLRGKLRPAWDSVESWQLELTFSKRKPLAPQALRGLCCTARRWALRAVQGGDGPLAREWLLVATFLEISFFALLRPGEAFNLLVRHICFPTAEDLEQAWAHLVVMKPKNRKSMGRVQFAIARCAQASSWLRFLLVGCSAATPLWPFSQARFRRRFTALLGATGLSQPGFTLGCLRAGGATFFHRSGVEPSRLKYWGRWKSEFSTAHYIQEACAFYVLNQLPADRLQQLDALVAASRFTASPEEWWNVASRHVSPAAGRLLGEDFERWGLQGQAPR